MSARGGPLPLAAAVGFGLVAWALSGGDATFALAPLVVFVVLRSAGSADLSGAAKVLFFLAMLGDSPKEHPAEGRWTSPLAPIGLLLYENLNTLTGIESLRFSCVDVMLAVFCVLVATRRTAKGALPVGFDPCLLAMLLGALWLEAWGLARGGDFKASLWQVRPFLWMPCVAYVYARALSRPRDYEALGSAVIAAAVVKAIMGFWYYQFVCKPTGHAPEYVTTHSDTVLFVSAIMVVCVGWYEERTRRAAIIAVAAVPILLIGIVLNGRRLAYVSLAASLVTVYLILPRTRARRTLTRTGLAMVPVAAMYLAIGWRSTGTLFGPARKVASLFSEVDRSSWMRDIENYNLLVTWKQNLLLGAGFGHEYLESVQGDDIKRIFPMYRYIAHNSVLGLASTGGLVGFAAVWALPAAGAFFAARAYRVATEPRERVTALFALSVVIVFINQAYGDMGVESGPGIFLFGAAIAAAARLCATGARAAREAPAPDSHAVGSDRGRRESCEHVTRPGSRNDQWIPTAPEGDRS